jgi:hypothetical protein
MQHISSVNAVAHELVEQKLRTFQNREIDLDEQLTTIVGAHVWASMMLKTGTQPDAREDLEALRRITGDIINAMATQIVREEVLQ